MSQIVKVGNDSFNYLNVFLKENSPKRILLVSGKESFTSSGAKEVLYSILEGYKFFHFFNFEKNPRIEDVEEGVKMFNENNCDLIIAIGGGSVIDMAKLIKFFNNKKVPFTDHFNSNFNTDIHVPLVVAPTTAGAGSEATHFAVVYVDKRKFSIANNNILPNLVLIDSSYLSSQSKYQMIVSGIDALAQGIESYWCVNSNEESMKFSERAIKLVWGNLKRAIAGGDKVALENLSRGAYFAGKAINITKTTGPHALSYGFTMSYGLPHGHSVALFLPFFIKFHNEISKSNCNDIRGDSFVRTQMRSLERIIGIKKNTIESEVSNFIKELDIEINFEKINIDFQGFKQALEGLNQDRLKNNPRFISKEEIEDIYSYNREL